jgi:hypothetical protein
MSANPHSVVHSRQYNDVEKTKEEQPRKSEPGVKGMVSGDGSFAVGSFTLCVLLQQSVLAANDHSFVCVVLGLPKPGRY